MTTHGYGSIAVIGMACHYPDAESPQQLWENVLSKRRAFRRLPEERMRSADYYAADRSAPDRFYCQNAAVIEGYEFDRVRFAVAGSTYRSTDLTHWLALDVADRALADAGFPGGDGLRRQTTGVVVGNTLTGEFTRANLMRLRWPYVRRTVGAALREQGWSETGLLEFLDGLEARYKAPFPPVDEDTLAGGLSNTIAGRICNYFDFGGGGYTVDGACSSSMLSVITGCRALESGELDAVVAGGVDLSIDPFEIIGFAKTGAVTGTDMKVYDQDSAGFWPGEGCGMVVLMRARDAERRGLERHALIRGWGVSSDGRGSITRPRIEGYRTALERAYAGAGFGPEAVDFFEGHSTGTKVGDDVELRAISSFRRAADASAAPAAVGSIKALIGHTKAACGVAGLIKAVMAVRERVLPPTAGCARPHDELLGEEAVLRAPDSASPWPAGRTARAGVTSMGFGGINSHVVLEGASPRPEESLSRRASMVASSYQDAELLVFDADDREQLRDRVATVARRAGSLAFGELADVAARLHGELCGRLVVAAVVVSTPSEAELLLGRLLEVLDGGRTRLVDPTAGIYLGDRAANGHIGFLFPGQATSGDAAGGLLRGRFATVDELYRGVALPSGDPSDTAIAQPRIALASLAGIRVLREFGVAAALAVGHSLGELTALHWAGSLDEEALVRIAGARGAAMREHGIGGGAMAAIAAGAERLGPIIDGDPVVIAGINAPSQTVIAGPADAVRRVGSRGSAAGLAVTPLPVSHAFHSPLVAPSADVLAAYLAGESLSPPSAPVVSTVTGARLTEDTDLVALLRDQVTSPVRFSDALLAASSEVDAWVEVGPGSTLAGPAGETTGLPVLPMDTAGRSVRGVLHVLGAALALGLPARTEALFEDRLTRPIDLDASLRFFASPCEQAPELADTRQPPEVQDTAAATSHGAEATDSVELLRRLVAERAELPVELISAGSRPLDELHLSSITVGQIVNEAARELGVSIAAPPTGYATASLAELAEALDEVSADPGGHPAGDPAPTGVETWVRPFGVELVEQVRPAACGPAGQGDWRVFAPADHPLAAPLHAAVEHAGLGGGVLVCLSPGHEEQQLGLLLEAARAVLAGGGRFVLVQHGVGAAAFAKTLHLEAPHVPTCVVDIPPLGEAVDRVVAEIEATDGFTEVHYGEDGIRRVPRLRALPDPAGEFPPCLDPDDVVLVTGGGRGITAECARAVALETGARLALLGRADPREDAELAANLDRLATDGVTYRYVRADVTDAADVLTAAAEVRAELGEVTAVLHGAGRNRPVALSEMDFGTVENTVAPKVTGLRNVLDALDPARLRLLVTFGSVIGRAGLRGQADYALANEWMSAMTVRFGQDNPGCRCRAVEWSVWSGVGMGERLGAVHSLLGIGVTPVSADRGVELLRRLVSDESAPTVAVVCGRMGELPTLALPQSELPLLRFVERPVVHYPGIELVTEIELDLTSDPYLADHILDGDALFPAVLGLEAMAQVAGALTGQPRAVSWEDVEFARPIVVPPGGSTVIRIAALERTRGTVDVVIRSAETGFAADHFRASCVVDSAPPEAGPAPDGTERPPAVPLDPATELYGDLLFQGKRFRRLLGYRRLSATGCVAELSAGEAHQWFGMFLPGELIAGDPGVRDAMMHAIQGCVPDATLLPGGVERIWCAGSGDEPGQLLLYARERRHADDIYLYDLEVREESGRLVERWEGLRLHAVRRRHVRLPWPAPLLGSVLEREFAGALGAGIAVAAEREAPGERRTVSERAASRTLGRTVALRHRADGRPEIDGVDGLSIAHGAGVTLAVTGDGPLGCDIEIAERRTAQEWSDLLGTRRNRVAELLAAELDEDISVTATRVWCGVECAVKAGISVDEPITAGSPAGGECVLLTAGALRVATLAVASEGDGGYVVFAVARPIVEGGEDA